jgi:hypothetical protein
MKRLATGLALLAVAGCGGGGDRKSAGGDEGAPRSQTTRVDVIESSGK